MFAYLRPLVLVPVQNFTSVLHVSPVVAFTGGFLTFVAA